MSEKIARRYLPAAAVILQNILLFFLRQLWLRTVFQTVISYAALSMVGIFLMVMSQKRKHDFWSWLWDSYLMFWSGVQAVIILGFMTCGTFYFALTRVTLVQIVNVFLGVALYWLLFLVFRRTGRAIGVGNLLIGCIGTVNFYLVKFRGAPFRLADIRSIRTAGNVVSNYDFKPNIILLGAIVNLAGWYLVWRGYDSSRKKEAGGTPYRPKRINPVFLTVTGLVAAGCIAIPVIRYDKIYANTFQFVNDTYLAGLVAEWMGSAEALPENYSLEEVRRIVDSFQGVGSREPSRADQKPNIVVIMNEAFSDLRILGEFKTNVPILEYWDSLKENTIRGWANVSVLGGNTANSEYEFLTSDTLGAYQNKVPYNSYFSASDSYPSLVSVLKKQGYDTAVFHPYMSSGWNRLQVYRNMQFDQIVFLDNVGQSLETLRLYVSDESDYSYVRNWFEEKEPGKPQFFFNITMQNHGGYTYRGDNFETTVRLSGDLSGAFPETEQYLSLIKASDEALRNLLDYFAEYDEPVIVVMFGDHQPSLEEEFYTCLAGQPTAAWGMEQRMNLYKTPFIIWHNYPSESRDLGDVSLNYLAPLLLEDAGLGRSPYQDYVLSAYEEIPVVTALGMTDREGSVWRKGSVEFEEKITDYRTLIYNHTVDIEGRINEFFSD